MSASDSLSTESRGRNPLRTLQHGLRVLEAISRSPGSHLGARELQEQLGLRERACYDLLETLSREGYVVRFSGGRYGIGPKFERVHSHFLAQIGPDPRIFAAFARLGAQVDQPISVNGWYGSDIVVQRLLPGWRSPDWQGKETIGIGYRELSTSRATTKAILAFVSEEQLLRHFASRAHPATTERTITDFQDFRGHLLEVAERGYALDLAETQNDLCGVAAPFFTHLGFPTGCFGVPVPVEVFDSRRESIVGAVTEAGLRASRALGYSGPYPPPSPLLKPRSAAQSESGGGP